MSCLSKEKFEWCHANDPTPLTISYMVVGAEGVMAIGVAVDFFEDPEDGIFL